MRTWKAASTGALSITNNPEIPRNDPDMNSAERRDQRHAGQEGERYRQAASSFSVTGRSTVLGAFLGVGFFFFLAAGLGSTVGSTGRSPNCLASSRRL